MANRAVYLLLAFVLIPITHQAPTYVPTYLYLTRVGPCHSGEATGIVVNEMSITREQYNFSISGRLNVTRDIPEGWMVRATMQKCQDIRNLDTCDHFKSFTAVENACTDDEMADDKELYQSVFNVSTPRLSCPIKAGVYQISNYPFVTRDNHFMVSESKISTSLFGYTFRLDGYSDDEKIMCIEAYLQLVYATILQGKDIDENEPAEDDDVTGYASDDDDGDEDNDSKADGDYTDAGGAKDADDAKASDDDTKAENAKHNGDSKAEDATNNDDDSNVDDAKANDNAEEGEEGN